MQARSFRAHFIIPVFISLTLHQHAAAAVVTCNAPLSFWCAAYGNVHHASAFLDLGHDVNAKSQMCVVMHAPLSTSHVYFHAQWRLAAALRRA